MEPTLANVKMVIEKSVGLPVPSDEKSLFDLGLIGSMDSVELIVELERAFSVQLSVFDFAEPENFTVKQIAEIVARRKP